jgi:hypothetical protein
MAMDQDDPKARALDYTTLMEALNSLSDSVVIYGPDHRPLFINQIHRQRFPIFCAQLDGGATAAEAMAGAARRHMPTASEDNALVGALGNLPSQISIAFLRRRAEWPRRLDGYSPSTQRERVHSFGQSMPSCW